MKLSVFVFSIGVLASWASAQFLNNKPFPTYSLESMPDTDFSCNNKVVGSYYADIDTQCQMFHICVRVSGLGVQDFRFLCPNGTAFDQDHQICAEWEDVDCDYSTLYYASDNFDLYRIGSGFESKAVKYGEEEEVFALQRAETGDARINREQQVQRVNQQKQFDNPSAFRKSKNTQYRNENNDEIFKGSSSSNFFNNRNGGKENDDEYEDKNVNYNQDRDQEQRRKVNRHKSRRPVKTQTEETETQRPSRPTGFLNNFAGSSVSTTVKPSTTTEQQQRVKSVRKQYNNADNFRQNTRNYDDQNANYPSTTYTISTPAPFRAQNQQSTTFAPKKTENYPNTYTKKTENYPSTYTKEPENYPSNFPKQKHISTTPKDYDNSQNYDIPKIRNTQNYPTTQNYDSKKQNDHPTTFAPKTFKPSTFNAQPNYPSTFSPRTNSGYTQISQQTTQQQKQNTQQFNTQNTQQYNTQNTQYNTQNTQYNTQQQHNTQTTQQYTTQPPKNTQQFRTQNTQYNAQTNQYNGQTTQNAQSAQYNNQNTQTTKYNAQNTQQFNTRTTQLTTSKPSPFTQYTPTVPKISPTTPVARSNRYDETQYDDGSYNSKYDSYDNNDEFLKAAHSTNIASSRNEFAKSAKNAVSTTAKPYYESPRPFSVTTNAPRVVEEAKTTPKLVQKPAKAEGGKKEKNASYDYAYYDSNPQGEAEYDIDTDFKKSTAKV